MAKGRDGRDCRTVQGEVEFSHFPPAVHFDLIRKQAVVIPALSRYFFDSSEISESVNFCVMEAIKLCRLDTPIIFIEARINLSRFVVTGCAAKTSATVTFPRLILILNSFLGSSDSLVFSELFHSLAPRPLAARSISDFLLTYLAT